MNPDRRQFLKTTSTAAAAAGLALAASPALNAAGDEPKPRRKFTICLACGTIGVADDPPKAIDRARRFGFESIEPSIPFLSKLSDAELKDYQDRMREANLSWGAAGLPVQFRGDDAAFDRDLRALPD